MSDSHTKIASTPNQNEFLWQTQERFRGLRSAAKTLAEIKCSDGNVIDAITQTDGLKKFLDREASLLVGGYGALTMEDGERLLLDINNLHKAVVADVSDPLNEINRRDQSFSTLEETLEKFESHVVSTK